MRQKLESLTAESVLEASRAAFDKAAEEVRRRLDGVTAESVVEASREAVVVIVQRVGELPEHPAVRACAESCSHTWSLVEEGAAELGERLPWRRRRPPAPPSPGMAVTRWKERQVVDRATAEREIAARREVLRKSITSEVTSLGPYPSRRAAIEQSRHGS